MKLALGGVACLLLVPVLAMGALAGGVELDASPGSSLLDSGDLRNAVLSHPDIVLSLPARRDVEAGAADARALSLLLALAERHRLVAGPIKSGHSYFVRGTFRVSNHSFGRAVDISVIDGNRVAAANPNAYDAVLFVLTLQPPLRPDEVGAPWRFDAAGSFSDGDHRDHIHLGWEGK